MPPRWAPRLPRKPTSFASEWMSPCHPPTSAEDKIRRIQDPTGRAGNS